MTEELVGKISYKSEKVRVKVTYELECDSVSGEISYGNLVDIVDVKPIEKSPSSIQNSSIIKEFIQAGNSLKKQQIEVLLENNFQLLAEEYKTEHLFYVITFAVFLSNILNNILSSNKKTAIFIGLIKFTSYGIA
jgi:hypothetical protein